MSKGVKLYLKLKLYNNKMLYLELINIYPEEIANIIFEYITPNVKYILYNSCYGGFGISEKAKRMYMEREMTYKFCEYKCRFDKEMIKIFDEIGKEINDKYSKIKKHLVLEDYPIEFNEYDGLEYPVEDFNLYYKNKLLEYLYKNNLRDSKKIILMKSLEIKIERDKKYIQYLREQKNGRLSKPSLFKE